MACETNDEARMTKDETNPNEQIVGSPCQFPNANLVIKICAIRATRG
jgi:hypothetical protein